MSRWLEEGVCLALLALAFVSLAWREQEAPAGPERLLPLIHLEAVAQLEAKYDAADPVVWRRPEEGWLEASGPEAAVFRVLWELSRLQADLPSTAPAPVVRALDLRGPWGTMRVELGRLRAGHVVPLHWQGRWVNAPGDLWEALEMLRLAGENP